MAGKTKKYYDTHPGAKKVKAAYDKAFNRKPEQRRKRSQLTQARRDRGIDGKGGGDLHHGPNGLVRESVSKNRGRKEKSRVEGSKRS